MTHPFLAGISAVAVVSAALFLVVERPAWLPVVGGSGEEPILVFLVGSREGVEIVKRAVDPERIVVETPDAIALVEGRMVATDAHAVSQPLMDAGWSDRSLELLSVPRDDGRRRRGGEQPSEADAARMARLTELMNKPTLTSGEAMVVLQAMNDGLL
jgi:hypothetical protein